MKIIFKVLAGILFLNLLIISCKKDEGKIANYIKINDETYFLSEGILENFGANDWHNGYNFDLTFFSDGITINNNNTQSGSGEVIYFEMFSNNSVNLSSGEYDYNNTDNPYPVFTFDWSRYCLNWTSSGNNIYTDIISGVVTIIQEGDSYDITFTNGMDNSGNTVTAHYRGTLDYIDYTSKKSAKTRH